MADKSYKWIKIILVVNTIILIGFVFYSISMGSHYIWDSVISMFVFYTVFFIRKKIDLHPFHYFLFAIFLIVHNLGVFSYGDLGSLYATFPLGMEYDFWVHTYFGFISSLILYRAFYYYKVNSPYFIIVAVLVVTLGFSAFHELVEYAGALTLGKGEGLLFIGAGDIDTWDTQKDLLNNLIGGMIGLAFYGTWNSMKKRKFI